MRGSRVQKIIVANRRVLVGLIGILLLAVTASINTSGQTKSVGISGPGFSKVFLPNTIGPGSTTTLRFDINNSESQAPVSNLAFTDTLPAGMTIADPANASTTCAGGILSAPDGGTTISFSDGMVGLNSNCSVVVNVVGTATATNTSGTLTSSAGTGGTATATLTVNTALPGFRKNFAPSLVPLGGKSTLTFTMDNTLNSARVGTVSFTDNLPAGMVVANPANATTNCISPGFNDTTLTANPGSGVITLQANGSPAAPGFEVLPIGGTCTVTVDVIASGGGKLGNTTGDLLADFVIAGKASATLEVSVSNLAIRKQFTDDPVPPGGTVTLEFIINNFDRNFSAVSVAFTDDLTTLVPALAGLTFNSLQSGDCGGTVTGVGGTTIGFSGGAIAPESFCTIRVNLSVPAGATPGNYTNTSSTVTATVNGSPVVGNMATDILSVQPVPVLTKEFRQNGTLLPDPIVKPGDQVVLRFTVTNTSTTSMATDVAFLDELTDGSGGSPPDTTTGFLPFPVTVGLPPNPDPPCGAGSSLALVSAGFERQALSLTGGSLAASGMMGSSCSFDVTVTIPTDFPPGIYLNTTEQPSATVNGSTRIGKPASDTLTVISAPRLTKEFTNDPVAPGGTVNLKFTLSYPEDASGDATAISFTDNLAPVLTGLTATGLPLAAACDPDGPGGNPGTGTLSGSAGNTLLTFMGGTLSPGQSCSFSVTLTVPAGAAPGLYVNTTSGVSATVEGLAATSLPASDSLNVSGLRFTKSFLGDPVIAGATLPLRFTIANIHPTDNATINNFTDNLSAALTGLAATGSPSVNTCGGTLSGTTFLTYSGGSVLSGATCMIEVAVLVPSGAADGNYNNITSSLSTSLGSIVPATDVLTVNSTLLQLTKEFTNDPVSPGGTVNLHFKLTNLDPSNPASGISFTDNLTATLAGLTAPGPLSTGMCDGTLTGTSLLSYSGGSLPAGGSCSFDVTLNVPAGAPPTSQFTNVTSQVTGTLQGLAVKGDPATDNLIVGAADSIAPVITYTPLQFTNSTANPTLSVTITDNVAVDRAVIGFRINGGSLQSNPCTLLSGSAQNGTWNCTITGTLASPSAISYFVSADDLAPNTASSPTLGAGAPNLYTIGAPVVPAGTYTNLGLGAGTTFAGDINVLGVLTIGGIVGTDFVPPLAPGSKDLGSVTNPAVTLGCAGTIVGGGPNNYLLGNLAKQYCAPGTFTYPIGTARNGSLADGGIPPSEYSPFTSQVTALGVNPSTLKVSVTDGILQGTGPEQSASRYWTVTETGDLTANISFTYLDQDVNGVESSYKVLRREVSFPEIYPGGTVNIATNTASAPGVTNFSRWTAGNLGPTAALVEIGGRVLTPDGRGIYGAQVLLTDATGNTVMRRTNPFGYYRFSDIPVGETYVLTVVDKAYTFGGGSRVVFINGEDHGIDFIAEGTERKL